MRREKNSACVLVCLRPADTIRKARCLGRLLWVMTIFLLAAVAHAEAYYVNPSGSDSNPGTAAAPFRTINRALAFIGTAPGAGAGQVVVVARGTDNKALCSIFRAGLPGLSLSRDRRRVRS